MRLLSTKYVFLALALGIAVLLMIGISGTAAASGPPGGDPSYGSDGGDCCQPYWNDNQCCQQYQDPCCQQYQDPVLPTIPGSVLPTVPGSVANITKTPVANSIKTPVASNTRSCCQQYPRPCCQQYSDPCCQSPGRDDCYYRVRYGDGLYRIVLRFGTSRPILADANGLRNGNYIYAVPGSTHTRAVIRKRNNWVRRVSNTPFRESRGAAEIGRPFCITILRNVTTAANACRA